MFQSKGFALQSSQKVMITLRLLALLLLCHALSAAPQRQKTRPGKSTPQPAPSLQIWVSAYNSNGVHRFDAKSGAVVGPALNAPGAQSVSRGPDGRLYICAEEINAVLRFYGTQTNGRFVWDDPTTMADETGGLDGPTAAVFGPDGNLYVASFNSDAVLRYDGQTGAFIDFFVTAGQGGLNGPDAGMLFGPDGHLYVPSFNNNRIIRYNGTSGANLGVFANQTSGLNQPRAMLFRPNGDLWVSSSGSGQILAYDSSGAFLRQVIAMRQVTGFAIHPKDQLLYAATSRGDRVRTFDPTSGALIQTFIPGGSDGMDFPTFVSFIKPLI